MKLWLRKRPSGYLTSQKSQPSLNSANNWWRERAPKKKSSQKRLLLKVNQIPQDTLCDALKICHLNNFYFSSGSSACNEILLSPLYHPKFALPWAKQAISLTPPTIICPITVPILCGLDLAPKIYGSLVTVLGSCKSIPFIFPCAPPCPLHQSLLQSFGTVNCSLLHASSLNLLFPLSPSWQRPPSQTLPVSTAEALITHTYGNISILLVFLPLPASMFII